MVTVANTTKTVSIADIDQERAGILKRVLFGILRSDGTQKVIAQAIDGLPIEETYELRTTERYDLLERLKPSDDSMARASLFCTYEEMFDNLELNARVCLPASALSPFSMKYYWSDSFNRLFSSISSHPSSPISSICIF